MQHFTDARPPEVGQNNNNNTSWDNTIILRTVTQPARKFFRMVAKKWIFFLIFTNLLFSYTTFTLNQTLLKSYGRLIWIVCLSVLFYMKIIVSESSKFKMEIVYVVYSCKLGVLSLYTEELLLRFVKCTEDSIWFIIIFVLLSRVQLITIGLSSTPGLSVIYFGYFTACCPHLPLFLLSIVHSPRQLLVNINVLIGCT